MFTNLPGCTVYEKTVVDRAPAYVRHQLGAVYWENTVAQADGNDRAPQNEAFILIPAASTVYIPKTGDRIVDSIIIDEAPPQSAMTVMSVNDFLYGSPKVQHLEVKAR